MPQLLGVRSFLAHVELVEDGVFVVGNDFPQMETSRLGDMLFEPGCEHCKNRDVFFDDSCNVRADDLDDDVRAIRQLGSVHLSNRCGCHWFVAEACERRVRRSAERFFDDCPGPLTGKWRHGILQPGELVSNLKRNEIAPGGEHLPEFDEDWSQILQCQAQAQAFGELPLG